MSFKILPCFVSLPLLLALPGAQAAWDEKLYNPMPAEGDVILPMPCDGFMAFRKVSIPLQDPLADYPLHIGQDSQELGYVEQSRPVFIAGSFASDSGEASRHYLIAKYEMTQLQHRSLTEPECPTPANKLRLPATDLGWLQAMQAAETYNLWLRKNALQTLPTEDGQPGFMRLPTEVEWEFAARGGLHVSAAEFRDTRYPMPEGIQEYEWLAGPQSSNGKLQLTGLLKPNPLGLHDMLGNADEMMFEPFRLNKLDRQHGQAGGYIIRGGDISTSQGNLHTAQRQERSYYEGSRPSTSKTTGLRLVLVSPTLTSSERVASLESSWKKLGGGDKAESKQTTTMQELEQLAAGVEDKKLKNQLETLKNQLRASNQQQEEARDQAIRASLNLGAFLCTKMLDDGLWLDFLQSNYDSNCSTDTPDSTCPMRSSKLDEQKNRVHKLSLYYASSLIESASLYGEPLLSKQMPVMQEIITANPRLKELMPYLKSHWTNQQSFLKNQKIDTTAWLEHCKAIKSSQQ